MKVLITGISGRLGQTIARLLVESRHEVLGIDKRPWDGAPEEVQIFEADLRKRPAEDVFRSHRPDAVVHMATVTHLHVPEPEHHRMSLGGTKAAIDYCDRYDVGQAVFVGRHTYYGATADSPLYHTEDEPPMAADNFPELADLVAADLFAGSALWRYPELKTVVLRLCYTLGASHHGTLADFLRGPRVPTVLGFDPLFQFMHELDAARAVVSALEENLRGVFNVAGPAPLPLSKIIEETGREQVSIPEPVYPLTLGRFGLPWLPRGAVSHVKYPIVVDTRAFREACGFTHKYDEYDTMQAFYEQEFVSHSPDTDADSSENEAHS